MFSDIDHLKRRLVFRKYARHHRKKPRSYRGGHRRFGVVPDPRRGRRGGRRLHRRRSGTITVGVL